MLLPVAINHMTVARKTFRDLADLAGRLGCAGVELRDDLNSPLLDGMSPENARAYLAQLGLQVFALAEVKSFNNWNDDTRRAASRLIDTAARVGAMGVSLIPRNDNRGMGNGERQANLRLALRELAPMLADAGLVGLIEPLGFETSSLRHKSEVIDVLEALGLRGQFALIHDTFHHHLAGGGPVFAADTAIVHVSGVTDGHVAVADMSDMHRVLVDAKDRLGNIDQLHALLTAGYSGAVSFEAFAPQITDMLEPQEDLEVSIRFIRERLTPLAA